MFFETLKLALRAISRNLLRSFLTVLGVVIGGTVLGALAIVVHQALNRCPPGAEL